MEYNSQRPRMQISEYGRYVHLMIDQALATNDRELRTKMANAIIQVMGQLNPHLREMNDYKHKLWDHLFIMSEFKLDVDSPYPKPEKNKLETKPDRILYPQDKISHRHYGKYIQRVIEESAKVEDPQLRESLISSIAHHLKKSYLMYNRDSVEDDIIFKDMDILSKGTLKPGENLHLAAANELISSQVSQSSSQGKKFGKRQNKSHRFRRKFGTGNAY